MRLLILNQFFYPDISATSQLMTELAEDLAARGIEITVLCSQSGYLDDGSELPREEMYKGIRIVRVLAARFTRASLLRRLWSYFTFHRAAFFKLRSLARQDCVLVLSTPPLIALVAGLTKFSQGHKVVHLVQDLYPDIAIQSGVLSRGSVVSRLLQRLSRLAFRWSDQIVALGACMKWRITSHGVPPEKVQVIPNWADGSRITRVAHADNIFRMKHGLEDRFVVLYSGNMGAVHDMKTILDAARLLASDGAIDFVFVGDGSRRHEVETLATQYGLKNVRLLPYEEKEMLRYSLGAGDISLVSLGKDFDGLVVPSKLYGVMAAGRSVIYVGPEGSDAARAVREARCGYVIANRDAEGLAAAIRELKNDDVKRGAMAARARDAFEREYDRKLAVERYERLLLQVAGKPTDQSNVPVAKVY